MRGVFSGLLLACTLAGSAHAQQNRNAPVLSRDSVIIVRICPQIDTYAQSAFNRLAATRATKPVPLAGQKQYFGAMNDFMNSFVRQYMAVHSRSLNVVHGRGLRQFTLIDNILTKHQIPKELKYLAVIESALNNKALSGVGAYGPWQLMPGTAQMLGLTVNDRRDDRTDWYKSTNAAARYLRILYSELNDWLLVVAAYNSGPVPVRRAIDRTGSRNFWDIKKYLPRETQGHVLAFVATATIFETLKQYLPAGKIPADYKFSPDDNSTATVVPEKPRFTDAELASMAIIKINEPIDFDILYQMANIDLKLLNRWNPDYSMFVYGASEEPTYALRIPKAQLDDFIAKKHRMTEISRQRLGDETNR